jgi:hypothetical protein
VLQSQAVLSQFRENGADVEVDLGQGEGVGVLLLLYEQSLAQVDQRALWFFRPGEALTFCKSRLCCCKSQLRFCLAAQGRDSF